MRTPKRIFFLTFVLIYFLNIFTPVTFAEQRKKSILILFPYNLAMPAHTLAYQTFKEEFNSVQDLSLDVNYEFLDLNSNTSNKFTQEEFNLLTMKYHNKHIDLVIVDTELMLKLWLEHRNKILPDTPIVYYDTYSESFNTWKLPNGVIGVSGDGNLFPSIKWMMQTRPSVNEVVVIHGMGPIDLNKDAMLPIEELKKKMGNSIKFTDLSALPFKEIKHRIAGLSSKSVVLYQLIFQDADGVEHLPLNALAELTKVSSVPVISGYDIFIGSGTIGGYQYSIEQQVRQATKISLRILKGKAVEKIAVDRNIGNQYVFDQIALQKYNIPLSALPPNSIIKNRQYSMWDLYQPQIIATSSAVVILLLLVLLLSVLTNKLNHTKRSLHRLNTELEAEVQERTHRLNEINISLQNEIQERVLLEEKLRLQATTDELTKIPNRRSYFELATREIKLAARFGSPLSIAIIDLDYFKNINDSYGHAVGDNILKSFTKVCLDCIRETDVLARFGGDEFVMLLPDTESRTAKEVIERVRITLKNQPIMIDNANITLSISSGIASITSKSNKVDIVALLEKADQALYRAKEMGRNRIEIASIDPF